MNVIQLYNKNVLGSPRRAGTEVTKIVSPRPQRAQELEDKDSKQIRI